MIKNSKNYVENKANNKESTPQQYSNLHTEDKEPTTKKSENPVPTVEKDDDSNAIENGIIFTTAEIIDFSEGADSYN